MERFLMEKAILKQVVVPVDLNTADNTGLRVDMKNLKRCTFIVMLAAGTTTTAHTFNLKQHNVASAGTPAVLSVLNPYFHKIGAATIFTKVDPPAAADSYDLHALLSNSASIVVFEVLAENLTDGYRWVSLDMLDAGGAQLGSVIALGDTEFNPGYKEVV